MEEQKQGEEGILRRVTLDDQSYFVKSWRGKHYDQGEPLYYNTETNWKTAVSPFWPKVKFYEAQLVHQVLPQLTLAAEAGFDPRLSRDGKEFDFTKGRPTTISEEVEGDPALRRERDEILDGAYERLYSPENALWDSDGKFLGDANSYERYVLAGEVDQEVQQRFGQFLDVRRYIDGSTFANKKNTEHFVGLVDRVYAGTDIQTMVHAGVIPVHAEWNYIPTERTGNAATKGVFIEVSIFDLNRLTKALFEAERRERELTPEESQALTSRIEDRIGRYELLRKIDELWDEVYYKRSYQNNAPLLHDSEIGGALFQVLDSIRDLWDKGCRSFDNTFFYHLRMRVPYISASSTKEEAMAEIEELRRFMATSAEKSKAAA